MKCWHCESTSHDTGDCPQRSRGAAATQLTEAEPLVIHFDKDRTMEPVCNRLKARVQGQIVFIGDYWLYAHEAAALRDWLSKVLR